MDKFLLDTNILIHLMRGRSVAQQVKTYIDGFADPQLFISVVSLAEAESLVVQWKWSSQNIERLIKLMNSFISIDIEQSNQLLINNYIAIDAFSQGKQTAPSGQNLNNSSRNMGKNDLWIAATAYALEATLITTDRDFDHLHNLFFAIQKFET